MFDNLISFFIIMALGAFCKWKKPGNIEPDTARYIITTTVIKFFLPALCFKVIATAVIDKNIILLPVSAIITILLSLFISFIIYTLAEKFTVIHKKKKAL
jgi:predicted permease